MYVVEEITKLTNISDFYIPTEYPGVVSFKFYYGVANEEMATWWTGAPWNVVEPLRTRTFITGIVYNSSVNYAKKDSLSDCKGDFGSFFWDDTSQILYIHYDHGHQIDFVDPNFSYGIAIGLTNDTIRYFDDRVYMPFLKISPQIEESVDKFNYDMTSLLVDTLIHDNKSGFFDQFKATSIYGNKVTIKTGDNDDDYSDLVERANYYVEDYNFSAREFTLDVQDAKKFKNTQVPVNLLSTDDYPNVGDSNLGKPIPLGYGDFVDVPGLCVNEKAIGVPTSIVYFDDNVGSFSFKDELKTYNWGSGKYQSIGTPFDAGTTHIRTAIAALDSTHIALVDNNLDLLTTYVWDGSVWLQDGASLSISGLTGSSITALDATHIALLDDGLGAGGELRTYIWSGSAWSQDGNGLAVTGTSFTDLTTLSSTVIAMSDSLTDALRTFTWSDPNWSATGNTLTITGIGGPALATLTATTIAFLDSNLKELRTYAWDGTDWTLSGSGFTMPAAMNLPSLTEIDSTHVAFIDNIVHKLTTYVWNSSVWLQEGASLDVGLNGTNLALTTLGTASLTYPEFKFLDVLVGSDSSDIDLWVKNSDNVWELQVYTTDYTVNWTTGVATVNNALSTSGSNYGILDVKARVSGIANTYASDIIKDLNNRIIGLTYDSSNYDTTEWELEEVFLSPIRLYIDTRKELYDWIREIQSLSSVGFRYTNSRTNKLTIRVDNPNRTLQYTIPAIYIKNVSTVVAESSIEDVYNNIEIGYNQLIIGNTSETFKDTTYLDESSDEYDVTRVYNKVSGLITRLEAEDRAAIQAEDYYKIRPVFEVEVMHEDYLNLRLYDVVRLTLTLTKKQFTYLRVFQDTIGASKVLVSRLSTSETMQEMISGITVTEVGDEYFGIIRGQVVSKRPNYDFKTNVIRVRERPYSDIFAAIYP